MNSTFVFVYFSSAPVLAGHLEMTCGTSSTVAVFEYASSYLARPDRLAWTLFFNFPASR